MITVSGSFEDVSGVELGIQMTVVSVASLVFPVMFTVKKFLLSRYTPLKQGWLIFLREYISAAENFAGVFFCGSFFLRIEGNPQNPKKITPAKLNSYTVDEFECLKKQNQNITARSATRPRYPQIWSGKSFTRYRKFTIYTTKA